MRKFYWLLCFLLSTSAAWAQREVTGQVYDNDIRAPLQGVNVTVRNISPPPTVTATLHFSR